MSELLTITRTDAITAAGACAVAALKTRREVGLRRNAGPHNAAHRDWLRMMADEYEEAGRRLQRAADDALSPPPILPERIVESDPGVADSLSGMRGPDGELGTDVEPEAYLDAQDAAAEGDAIQADMDVETVGDVLLALPAGKYTNRRGIVSVTGLDRRRVDQAVTRLHRDGKLDADHKHGERIRWAG